ncbi:MAG: helix-turn-helix domain-containing protein [Kiloniellaceae bacterium]
MQARLEGMRALGMSQTAIRRALGLSERDAVAAGVIAPRGMQTGNARPRPAALGRRGESAGALKDGAGAAPARGPRMADVVEAVARAAGLEAAALLGRVRDRRHARIRQLVMYLLRELCPGASLPAIGYLLGRDHTTVLYGCRKAAALLARDATFRALHDRARRELAR